MTGRELCVVIGLGEVGETIYDMLVEAYGVNAVKGIDLVKGPREWDLTFAFMHICFPQEPGFVESVADYAKRYEPNYLIIHSTISPGMVSLLQGAIPRVGEGGHFTVIYYSPVRGNVKDGMRWCLERYTKYVAPAFSSPVHDHLIKAGFKVKIAADVEALAWAKLLDLAWYGLNIAFYQELERVVPKPWDYNVVREFIESTPVESEGKVPRAVFYGGYISGHCVIQAIEKILAEHDIPMLRAVIDSNIKRRIELAGSKPAHHPS